MNTVWVTGGRGFIGRHLSRILSQSDCLVFGIGHGACPPEVASKQGLQFWLNGDLEAHNFQQLLKQSGSPAVIYHLAGGSSVGLSIQTPAEDFRRSVVSTSALLEWVRVSAPQAKLVVTSSAAVYGNSSLEQIPEHGQYTPYSPYGFHKRAAELLCESYSQAYGLQIAIVRLFSVFGPGLRKQLLWDFCSKLSTASSKIVMQGTGDEIRDWFYVEDVVSLLTAASNVVSDSTFIINGGTGEGTSVRDIVDKVCAIANCFPEIEFNGLKREGDPFSLVANTVKSSELNFRPKIALDLGLKNYVQWFLRSKLV